MCQILRPGAIGSSVGIGQGQLGLGLPGKLDRRPRGFGGAAVLL